MPIDTAILTSSGFPQIDLNKQDVADKVDRLRVGRMRIDLVGSSDSPTATLGYTPTKDASGRHSLQLFVCTLPSGVHDSPVEESQRAREARLTFYQAVDDYALGSRIGSCRFNMFAQQESHTEDRLNLPNLEELPIWQMAQRIASQVPEKDWDAVPRDLARNMDHYLYGARKE